MPTATCSGAVWLGSGDIAGKDFHLRFPTGVNYSYTCDQGLTIANLTCDDAPELCAEQPVPAPFDPADLDPTMIAGAIGTGFFVLLPVWAAALGVKYLLRAISWR